MNLRVFLTMLLIYLQRSFAFRIDAIMWIINGMIIPFITMLFWIAVSKSQPNLPMNTSSFITYYLLLTVVERITQSWAGERLAKEIKDGKFSKNLIRPINYAIEYYARDIGNKSLRLITIIPFFLLLTLVFKNNFKLSMDFGTWLIFLSASIMGFFINTSFQHTFSLLAFFFDETDQLGRLLQKFTSLINGKIIPLILLPPLLQDTAKMLFPRFIVSLPLEIALKQISGIDIYIAFGIGFSWLITFSILHLFIWNSGIKRYTGVGI